MKAVINGIEVEGTPQEIAVLAELLGNAPTQKVQNLPEVNEPHDSKYVSSELAFRALKRRSLSIQQRKFLNYLAAKAPNWVTAKELELSTGYSRAQFGGLLGAFGKRVSSTDGYVDGTWFYDQDWDYENDCQKYRLPSHLIEVVKRAGI